MRAAVAVIHNFAFPLLVGEFRADVAIARKNAEFVVTTTHTATPGDSVVYINQRQRYYNKYCCNAVLSRESLECVPISTVWSVRYGPIRNGCDFIPSDCHAIIVKLTVNVH